MSSVARSFLRATARAARPQVVAPIRLAARRGYSSAPPKKSNTGLILGFVTAATGAGGYYLYSTGQLEEYTGIKAAAPTPFVPAFEDYQKVYNAIADRLEDNDYDDGSYGPVCPPPPSHPQFTPLTQPQVLLRLGWHASGTYDVNTKTGGSNGATMRFNPESAHGANAGLKTARDLLEPIKAQFPWISYSDLWIIGAICGIQEMGGPKVPFRAGREDKEIVSCTPGMLKKTHRFVFGAGIFADGLQ